ncbi:MAG TPA: Rho termination factor N-terminal domain-containing protein [Solirubrobacterales bacterium]|jgi:transcription termination factor Rho
MNKTELDSKHIAELHSLAAEAGVPRYRMLSREELIEKLLDGKPAQAEREPRGEGAPKRERPPRRRRERSSADRPPRDRPPRDRPSRERAAKEDAAVPPAAPEPASEPAPSGASAAAETERPRRKRRRRRFGRKSKGLGVTDLLLPPPGRQALVYGESREACTALLREIAGELSGENGPDPIALLVDPSPEELADWKREAPQAELVAAAQARHASDALAQAVRRAESGEDVILLVDSLSRIEDTDVAKQIFDGGLTQAKGSLTVVAALERP